MTAKKKPKIDTCKYAETFKFATYDRNVCRWHKDHIVPACDSAGYGNSILTSPESCDKCECWEPKRGKK
jgi:hypothetical protein